MITYARKGVITLACSVFVVECQWTWLKVLLTRVVLLILVLQYGIWVKVEGSDFHQEEYIWMVHDCMGNIFNHTGISSDF